MVLSQSIMVMSLNNLHRLNKGIDQIIACDDRAVEILGGLKNSTIKWDVRNWGMHVFCTVIDGKLNIHFSHSTADCCILATPTEMLKALKSKDISALETSGSQATAQSLFELLFSLKIEWENWLADYIPPLLVNASSYKIKIIKKYVRDKKEHLKNDWYSFVNEENCK